MSLINGGKIGLSPYLPQLPWIPYYITISPVQPWKVFTANLNGTVTVFEFEELK